MNPIAPSDPRTAEQVRVDELAAADDWGEFTNEVLMPDELALELIERQDEIVERHTQGLLSQPFLWHGIAYRIVRCQYVDGKSQVEVSPADPEFADELKRRVEQNRIHTLGYFQAVGFACFPEDYAKYQDA